MDVDDDEDEDNVDGYCVGLVKTIKRMKMRGIMMVTKMMMMMMMMFVFAMVVVVLVVLSKVIVRMRKVGRGCLK